MGAKKLTKYAQSSLKEANKFINIYINCIMFIIINNNSIHKKKKKSKTKYINYKMKTKIKYHTNHLNIKKYSMKCYKYPRKVIEHT